LDIYKKNSGKSPFFMGKSTFKMVLFNSFLLVRSRGYPSTSAQVLDKHGVIGAVVFNPKITHISYIYIYDRLYIISYID